MNVKVTHNSIGIWKGANGEDKHCFHLSADIRQNIICEANEVRRVREAFKEFPFLKLAAVQAGGFDQQHKVIGSDIIRVAKACRLLKSYPSEHLPGPGEAVDATTLHLLLSEYGYSFERSEFKILTGLLPDYSGERRYKLRAAGNRLNLTCSHSFKHSGAYYEVTFSGNEKTISCFPIVIHVVAYCDMDRLANHGEGCPSVLAQNAEDELQSKGLSKQHRKLLQKVIDENEGVDCNCEGWVCNEATMVLTAAQWDNSHKVRQKIAKWIEANIFAGRKEGKEEDHHFAKNHYFPEHRHPLE